MFIIERVVVTIITLYTDCVTIITTLKGKVVSMIYGWPIFLNWQL